MLPKISLGTINVILVNLDENFLPQVSVALKIIVRITVYMAKLFFKIHLTVWKYIRNYQTDTNEDIVFSMESKSTL